MPEPNPPSNNQFWKRRLYWSLSGGALLLFPILLGSTSLISTDADPPPEVSSAPSPRLPIAPTEILPQNLLPPITRATPALPTAGPTPAPQASTPTSTPRSTARPSAQPVPQRPAARRPASPPAPATALPSIPLRVAIANEAKTLSIGASTSAVVLDGQGRPQAQLPALTPVFVLPQAQGLQVGASAIANPVVWLRPTQAGGLVYLEGRWYRGALQLIRQGETLLAVNHLDLESYLYSVVGAEMPAYWSLEALKAQAIAARSYALVHISRPASSFYDLGATPRWQAYTGVESETNTTQAAVNATRGLLVSYRGGVVESLYAASDQLVAEAHKGFGMSQEGAQKLAQQRYTFEEILNYFYPGTQLARLQISQ